MPHSSLRYRITWHALALPAVVLLPDLVAYGRPPGKLPPGHLPALVALGVAYLLGAATLTVLDRRGRQQDLRRVVPVQLATLLLFYLPLLLRPEASYSRLLVVIGSACLVLLLPVPHVARPSARLLLAPAGLAATSAGLSIRDPGPPAEAPPGPTVRVEYVRTAHHVVRAVRYAHHLVRGDASRTVGGGVDDLPVSGGFLLARGDGAIHRLTWSGDSLLSRRLDVAVPLDRAAFAAAAGETVQSNRFRVADILVRDGRDTITVLASHHHWNPEGRCSTVRLSRVELPAAALEPGAPGVPAWRTVHETRPCLPFKARGRNRFAGHEMGGRLAFLDERRVLMTVGDHEFDGLNSGPVAAQEAGWEYGRTLWIDLGTGEAGVFALGQRNPQGLLVDGAGTVWSTEHGPQGGDELNRLVRGGNYGWPYRTWGTEYGALSWPLADTATGAGYRDPVYAWVPSVGISSLLAVEGPAFTRWRGDLVVASLRGRTLWRIRVRNDRVAFAEPLEIGSRVRDLVEGPDGALVLWTDSAEVIRLEPAEDREEGMALFQRYCGTCHKPGWEQAFAPNLEGVLGRPVAGSEGFDYSLALERMEGEWTEGRLRAFLREPAAVAPGTTMEFAGVRAPEHLDGLLRYLGTLGGQPGAGPGPSAGGPGG